MSNQKLERAVVYIRVGRTKRPQQAIARQRAACRAMADRSNIIIDNEFVDGNTSGKTLDRVALQELIWQVSSGNVDCVIAATEGALSTDIDDFIGLVTRFAGYGTIVGLADPGVFIDVTSGHDEATDVDDLVDSISA